MSLKDVKDKLEIGLKPDAPYRPTNQPATQQPHGPHAPGTEPKPSDEADQGHGKTGQKPVRP